MRKILLDRLLKDTGLRQKAIKHWIENNTINAFMITENKKTNVKIDPEDYITLKEIKTRKQLGKELQLYDYEIRELWKEIGEEQRFIDHMSIRYYTKDEARKIIELIEKKKADKAKFNLEVLEAQQSDSKELKRRFEICKELNMSIDEFNKLWKDSGETIKHKDSSNRPLYSLNQIEKILKMKGTYQSSNDERDTQGVKSKRIEKNSSAKVENDLRQDFENKRNKLNDNPDANFEANSTSEKSPEELLTKAKKFRMKNASDANDYNDFLLELSSKLYEMQYYLDMKKKKLNI